MNLFGETHTICLNKAGEELCGDQVRVFTSDDKILIVLSDGLGSGVKANILSTLTAEIITKMMAAGASPSDVIETVIGTLPTCKVRKLAYATFTMVEIERKTGHFQAYNFDNPALLYFHDGVNISLSEQVEQISQRKIILTQGELFPGDFLALVSDGVVFAGLGNIMNLGWGLPNIAQYIESLYQYHPTSAKTLVQLTMSRTRELYGGSPGDDACMVGVLFRAGRRAMVFTGPPLDEERDASLVDRLMNFDGKKIICGGTSANIVAARIGKTVKTDVSSLREDVPPMGQLEGIDLVTEGILTLNRVTEWFEQTEGDIAKISTDQNGATLLARTLLQCDEIVFLVGQRINPFYQNPLLPTSISIRRNLVEKIIQQLTQLGKRISVEFF